MKKIKEKLTNLVLLLLVLALISIIFLFVKIGFILWFWIIFAVWIGIFFCYFFTTFCKITMIFWITFAIWFIFSVLSSFGLISWIGNSKSTSSPETSDLTTTNGIKLSKCTSTLADKPQMLDGWKVTIYSAPYIGQGSNEVSNANSARTFSYKGLVDKSEPNSMHARFEKIDSSYITGYYTTMEVCNKDNMANYSYVTKFNNDNKGAGENTIASVNYFHGGKYVFEPGTYRIDAYIRDLSGKWHLIDRMENISITE
jgi:hypothetical protein